MPYARIGRSRAPRARRRRFRGRRCIDGSVAAPRDVVDTHARARAAAAAAALDEIAAPLPPPPLTLLVDHNADPAVANNRKFGDFVVRLGGSSAVCAPRGAADRALTCCARRR
jgi:hypothetical protein